VPEGTEQKDHCEVNARVSFCSMSLMCLCFHSTAALPWFQWCKITSSHLSPWEDVKGPQKIFLFLLQKRIVSGAKGNNW